MCWPKPMWNSCSWTGPFSVGCPAARDCAHLCSLPQITLANATLDGSKFAKLCRESKLIGGGLTPMDVVSKRAEGCQG